MDDKHALLNFPAVSILRRIAPVSISTDRSAVRILAFRIYAKFIDNEPGVVYLFRSLILSRFLISRYALP